MVTVICIQSLPIEFPSYHPSIPVYVDETGHEPWPLQSSPSWHWNHVTARHKFLPKLVTAKQQMKLITRYCPEHARHIQKRKEMNIISFVIYSFCLYLKFKTNQKEVKRTRNWQLCGSKLLRLPQLSLQNCLLFSCYLAAPQQSLNHNNFLLLRQLKNHFYITWWAGPKKLTLAYILSNDSKISKFGWIKTALPSINQHMYTWEDDESTNPMPVIV